MRSHVSPERFVSMVETNNRVSRVPEPPRSLRRTSCRSSSVRRVGCCPVWFGSLKGSPAFGSLAVGFETLCVPSRVAGTNRRSYSAGGMPRIREGTWLTGCAQPARAWVKEIVRGRHLDISARPVGGPQFAPRLVTAIAEIGSGGAQMRPAPRYPQHPVLTERHGRGRMGAGQVKESSSCSKQMFGKHLEPLCSFSKLLRGRRDHLSSRVRMDERWTCHRL